jgi:hypothetical protein
MEKSGRGGDARSTGERSDGAGDRLGPLVTRAAEEAAAARVLFHEIVCL